MSVAIGDMTGDGKPDLVTANGYFNTVSVLPGLGDGTFGPQTEYATVAASKVAIADVNTDGVLDIVAGAGTISVLLGNGEGGFARTDHYVGLDPFVIDVNGDSRPDLVGLSGGGASVLLGQGDGAFGPRHDNPITGGAHSIAVGDVNNDGVPDVVGGTTLGFSVLLGRGDGTFVPGVPTACGCLGEWEGLSLIALGDVNGDGNLDVATQHSYCFRGCDSRLLVYLGNGEGAFLGGGGAGGSVASAGSIAISDLNGDGKSDLISIWDPLANRLNVHVVVEGGISTSTVGYGALSVAIGDLDDDGRVDMATADGGTVAVSIGNGDGSFGPSAAAAQAIGFSPHAVASGDVNGDGLTDLVAAHAGWDDFGFDTTVLIAHENGRFTSAGTFQAVEVTEKLLLSDVNGDQRLDLLAAPLDIRFSESYAVGLMLGNGDGGFGPLTAVPVGVGVVPYSIATGDLNRDGRTDLVACGIRGGMSVLLGNGDGSFAPSTEYESGPSSITAVLIEDLDRDGNEDLVFVKAGLQAVSVRLGDGQGGFSARTDVAVGYEAHVLAADDLNGDANVDLIAGSVTSVAVGDLDADGTTDLALTGAGLASVLLGRGDGSFAVVDRLSAPGGHSVGVLMGRGDGTFGAPTLFGSGGVGPSWVGIGDRNGDGRPDLTVTNQGACWYRHYPEGCDVVGASVSVLLNTGPDGPTATLLSLFQANWTGEGFELRWRFEGSTGGSTVAIERGDRSDGPWTPVTGERRSEGETSILIDREVEAGHTYYYRLVVTESGGALTTFGPITATAGSGATQFTLVAIAPSPSAGSSRISFIMPREAHVRLSVLDVLGRRLALLADGTYPAGPHEVAWNATSGSGRAPAGLYFVRFDWPGGSSTRRLALTQ